MTEEEYLRFKNLLGTVIEQQPIFAENQAKADVRMTRYEGVLASADKRMTRYEEALAALLTLAEIHEQEANRANEQMNSRFEEVARKSAETDERINSSVNTVERYINRN